MISIIVNMGHYSQASINAFYSLTHHYQKNAAPTDWEVIVLGTQPSMPDGILSLSPPGTAITYLASDGTVNSLTKLALQHAKGEQIGFLFDGRRILTPRTIEYVKMAFKMKPSPLVAIPGYVINDGDAALNAIDWKDNGYRLFSIASPDHSNKNGFLSPLDECGALFCNKLLLTRLVAEGELDCIDTRHVANTLYLKLGMLEETALIITPGEGAFLHDTNPETSTPLQKQHAIAEKSRLMREPILIGSITYLAQTFFLLSAEHAAMRFLKLSKEHIPYWEGDAAFSRYTENESSDPHEHKRWPSWKIKPTKFWG